MAGATGTIVSICMGDLTGRGFGLVIAYLLPGFVLLLGMGQLWPDVQTLLRTSADSDTPTVGSFLYVLLASLTAGMTVGAFRWAIVDSLHHATGLVRPRLDLRRLHERLPAYEALIDYYYRYYEFFANSFIAAFASYSLWRFTVPSAVPHLYDTGFLVLEVTYFAASRNTLRNFYERISTSLGTLKGEEDMTNGGGHHDQVPTVTSPREAATKPAVEQKDPKRTQEVPPKKK